MTIPARAPGMTGGYFWVIQVCNHFDRLDNGIFQPIPISRRSALAIRILLMSVIILPEGFQLPSAGHAA